MDVHTRAQRSRNMAAIRCRDTRPEMIVRSISHRLGYRFRLHRRDLPGTPDLVFPRLRKIILVHGCYWHMHRCHWGQVTPKTNAVFWQEKRAGNVARDRRTRTHLRRLGWKVLVIWECEARDEARTWQRIEKFLCQPLACGPDL